MQDVIPTKALRRIITSHSLDNVFDYCARKFEFLALYDKRPARESGYAASVGTALHEGMQAWLIAREEGLNEKARTEKAFMALGKWFPWDMEPEQVQKVRSFDNTALMLYNMIRSPEWDDWELLWVDGKGWAVEVPFCVTHTSMGPIYLKDKQEYVWLATQGKIDIIARHKRTKHIKSLDIKTTSYSPDLIRANYTFSGQQTGYSQIAHAMAGVAPSAFSVEYIVACFTGDGPQIQFVPLHKSEDDVDDYWLAKMDRLERIKKYAEQGWFPRTNGGCVSWNHECSMFDICHTRDPQLIHRWYDFEIESEEVKGYEYWVELEA